VCVCVCVCVLCVCAHKELPGVIRVRQETDNKNPIERSTNPPRRAAPGKRIPQTMHAGDTPRSAPIRVCGPHLRGYH